MNTLPRDITGNLNVTPSTFETKLKTFYYTKSYSYIHVTPMPAISSFKLTDTWRVKNCII